ncbi:MAG TPA: ATP-binding protein [Candidatus Limnocylindrales bacterium]|nr:ATP-binding protein [Candidatus Limnocylindrales bacterium]
MTDGSWYIRTVLSPSATQLARLTWLAVAALVAVALASAAVDLLEGSFGVANASSVYLVAVALIAIAFGVPGAIVTAIASVVVYDYLFTQPRRTLAVADPGEWLNLVLLLFVAVTVGELAAIQRSRANAAAARERESRALFEVTRALANRESTIDALPGIARALARDATMARVWFALGTDADERVVAASDDGPAAAPAVAYAALHVAPDGRATWTLVRAPSSPGAAEIRAGRQFRVRLEAGGRPIGSLWAARRSDDRPDEATTRLLRVTADLVAQSLGQDRLVDETRRAAVAQQSDALKSALLESVSHDLRTPLASIRASAGTLMDPAVALDVDEARASAAVIDRQAQRLNRLVGNLLDLSRIEGGALRVTEEALDLEDVVARAVAQIEPAAEGRRIDVEISPEAVVLADPILLEEVLLNLLDNAIRHTPSAARILVRSSSAQGEGSVAGVLRLTVEDAGSGVADERLGRIFERFVGGDGTPRSARTGGTTGLGLAVVRGFVVAMRGRVRARRSDLGGLAVDVDLPMAIPPEPETRERLDGEPTTRAEA